MENEGTLKQNEFRESFFEDIDEERKQQEFWYNVLVQRYGYELARDDQFHSRASSILGIVPVVLGLEVAVITVILSYMPQYQGIGPYLLYYAIIFPLILSVYSAFRAIFDMNMWESGLLYPSDTAIKGEWTVSSYNTPADVNLDLSAITLRNAKINDAISGRLADANIWLVIGVLCLLVFGVIQLYLLATLGPTDIAINTASDAIETVFG